MVRDDYVQRIIQKNIENLKIYMGIYINEIPTIVKLI